jgi:hypothetical protein
VIEKTSRKYKRRKIKKEERKKRENTSENLPKISREK